MKKFRVLKLGTRCSDIATGLDGTLTHWTMDMDTHIDYIFQPAGLNEQGQPLDKHLCCLARLKVKPNDFEDVDVPVEILGSEVVNEASGFRGMATNFDRHLNGCFHVFVQPCGKLQSGHPIKSNEFDLRSLAGPMIKKMTEDEKRMEDKVRPSPMSRPARRYG